MKKQTRSTWLIAALLAVAMLTTACVAELSQPVDLPVADGQTESTQSNATQSNTTSSLTVAQAQILASLRDDGPAPELTNEVWLNSEPLTLADLRGNVVIVEFWTYG